MQTWLILSALTNGFKIQPTNQSCIIFYFENTKQNRGPAINDLNWLTDEGERGGEDEEHAVAEQSKGDGEVGSQAAPHKKLVDCCPVMGVQAQLHVIHIFSDAVCCNIESELDSHDSHTGPLTCIFTTISRQVCASKAKDW